MQHGLNHGNVKNDSKGTTRFKPWQQQKWFKRDMRHNISKSLPENKSKGVHGIHNFSLVHWAHQPENNWRPHSNSWHLNCKTSGTTSETEKGGIYRVLQGNNTGDKSLGTKTRNSLLGIELLESSMTLVAKPTLRKAEDRAIVFISIPYTPEMSCT